MKRNEFNEKIQKELEDFKIQTLELSKEEIYEKSFEIDFKNYLANYLQTEDVVEDETIENLSNIEDSVLDELYSLYLDIDGSYYFDEMCDELLKDFNDDFYTEEDEDGELE